MLFARALHDLRNSLVDSVKLQEQLATGRRVNRPSDDPVAALRILPLRAQVRDLGLMTDNAQLARETMNVGAAALEEASGLLQRVRELAVQAGNGTKSGSDLRTIGEEVDQLLQQMLGLANTNKAGQFLFGGTRTDAAPFRMVETDGRSRVAYDGNQDAVSIEVAPGVRTTLNAPGDAIFQRHERRPTLFSGDTGARPSGALDSGVGFDTLDVAFAGLSGAPPEITAGAGPTDAVGPLSYSFSGGALSIDGGPAVPIPAVDQPFVTADGRTIYLTVASPPVPPSGSFVSEAALSIDGGASTTVVDFSAAAVQVRDAADGSVLNVDVQQLARTGQEEINYQGTFDVFTMLIALRDTLRGADGGNLDGVRERTRGLIAEIDGAHSAVLDGTSSYGSRAEHMDLIRARVDSMLLGTRESLSAAEDVEIAEAILALNKQQMTYQASLGVSARVVQTSLLDYLR
jgi:flagellar hook-associated protein 3 FlgL